MVLPVADRAWHLAHGVVDVDAAAGLDVLVLEIDRSVGIYREVHTDHDQRIKTTGSGRVAGLEPLHAVRAPDVAGDVALRDDLAELIRSRQKQCIERDLTVVGDIGILRFEDRAFLPSDRSGTLAKLERQFRA